MPRQLVECSQRQDSGDDEAGPAYPPIPPEYAMVPHQILGKGGYKIVYLCAHPNACCMVSKNVWEDKHLIAEAEIMRMCNHPKILPVIVAGWHGGRFVIIAPLMKGDLHDKGRSMAENGDLNSRLLLRWVRDIASGLLYMHHECGIVHRDIKPSNILWDGDGQDVKIADFGLSKRGPCTEDVGTPSYKAPEIVGLDGQRSYSTPVDIFALAMMIIYILTGTNPFNNYEEEKINQRMRQALRTARRGEDPPTAHLPPQLWIITDKMWQPLLLQCLTVDPAARPSAGQLYEQCCEALAPPTMHDLLREFNLMAKAEELRSLGIEQEADLEEVDEDFVRDPECKLDPETKRRLMKMKEMWEARKTALLKPIVHSPSSGRLA